MDFGDEEHSQGLILCQRGVVWCGVVWCDCCDDDTRQQSPQSITYWACTYSSYSGSKRNGLALSSCRTSEVESCVLWRHIVAFGVVLTWGQYYRISYVLVPYTRVLSIPGVDTCRAGVTQTLDCGSYQTPTTSYYYYVVVAITFKHFPTVVYTLWILHTALPSTGVPDNE